MNTGALSADDNTANTQFLGSATYSTTITLQQQRELSSV